MKARNFLSACGVALALMVVMPAWAQEQSVLEQRTQDRLNQEMEQQALEDPSPLSVPFIVRQVAVECNGGCGDSTLGQLCGSGWRPIAVDCQNVQEWSGISCGGNNRCARFSVLSSDPLSFYCDDISGWDANVYCAQ